MDKLIRFLRKTNIRNRVATVLLAGLLVFSLIILLFSRSFSKLTIKNYLYSYMESIQKEAVASVELIMDEITMLSVRMQISQDIYSLIGDRTLSKEEKQNQLTVILDGILLNKDTVGGIVIFTHDGEVFRYHVSDFDAWMFEEDFFRQIEDAATPVWGNVKTGEENLLPVGVKYRNFHTGQDIGYLIICVRETALFEIYQGIAPEWGYSFITTDKDYVISHPDKFMVGKVIYNNRIYHTDKIFDYKTIQQGENADLVAIHQFSERLKRTGNKWKIISVLSYDKMFFIIDRVNRYLLMIGAVMFLISVFISVYLSRRVTSGFQKLKNELSEVGKGNFNLHLSGTVDDELWELEKSFNEMVARINDLIETNNKEKEKQRELELVALQAQINPHFLYNTLDAISWIAKLKKQNEIEKMVIALARFFRLSLHKGDKFISVGEEIQLLKSFITIEQMRFPGKFEVKFNIDDEVTELRMLKIILQPLVENAIKHGIRKKRGTGLVIVRGYKEKSRIRFEVIDDGVGFDVNHVKKTDKNISGSGYGLRNVNERIKLEYGQGCGIAIESEINRGTKVKVFIETIDE